MLLRSIPSTSSQLPWGGAANRSARRTGSRAGPESFESRSAGSQAIDLQALHKFAETVTTKAIRHAVNPKHMPCLPAPRQRSFTCSTKRLIKRASRPLTHRTAGRGRCDQLNSCKSCSSLLRGLFTARWTRYASIAGGSLASSIAMASSGSAAIQSSTCPG